MATTSPTERSSSGVATCPTCGAKKTRPDSTLCAYCATPFDLVAAPAPRAEGEASPHQARLARMAEHPEWQEAMAWTPLEGSEWQSAEHARRRGVASIAVAMMAFGVALLFGLAWLHLVAAVALVVGLVRFVRGKAVESRVLQRPLLRRAAIVLDRRSETAMGWWKGETTYYFQLELGDGSVGEFCWPGRGSDHAPLAIGATGVAYTRGAELLAFRTIRV